MKTDVIASCDTVTLSLGKLSPYSSLSLSINKFLRQQPTINLNSYKFSKPRVYVKNNYISDNISNIELLRDLSFYYGTKFRPESYNTYIVHMQSRNSKKNTRQLKGRVTLNLNSTAVANMKMLPLEVNNSAILALVDTGSSHCLMSLSTFLSLGIPDFEPVTVLMRVAGATMKDNVVGRALIKFKLSIPDRGDIIYDQDFLIAHHINDYQAIIGANFLFNSSLVTAITPNFL